MWCLQYFVPECVSKLVPFSWFGIKNQTFFGVGPQVGSRSTKWAKMRPQNQTVLALLGPFFEAFFWSFFGRPSWQPFLVLLEPKGFQNEVPGSFLRVVFGAFWGSLVKVKIELSSRRELNFWVSRSSKIDQFSNAIWRCCPIAFKSYLSWRF